MSKQKQPINLLKAKKKTHMTKEEIKRREQTEIKFYNDDIKEPEYLEEDLKKQFNYYASELKRINIMSNLDCEALAKYVVLEKQYQEISLKCLKTKVTSKFFDIRLREQEKLFTMSRKAANDLGLTISSRCKLVVPTSLKQEENKFNQFL